MINFRCTFCLRRLQVNDELAGKMGKCRHCGQSIRVPGGEAAEERPAAAPPVPSPPVESPPLGASALSPPVQPSKEYDFLAPAKQTDEIGRLGHYRVLKLLGAGGMGMVFQAEDTLLKRTVALKVMKPSASASERSRKRFLREAQAVAAIDHDHIISIYQVAVDRGTPYLAMPFLKGESLDQRLKRERIPIPDAIRIAREIAQGLEGAHACGLIHRDIKPANVWLETRGQPAGDSSAGPDFRVKILDFGLARDTEDDLRLTKEGMVLGTPSYMAPEQASAGSIDFRADLFSLGSILYRMCTGEPPFKGNSAMAIVMSVMNDEPRPIQELNPQTPPELAQLIHRLLAKKAEDRPASARAVIDAVVAIERVLSPGSMPSGPTAIVPATVPGGKSTGALGRWLTAAGVLLVAILAVGGAAVYQNQRLKQLGGDSHVEPSEPQQPVPPPKLANGLDAFDAARIIPSDRFEGQPVELVGIIHEDRGETGELTTLGFSYDGHFLATGGKDGRILVWDLAGSEPARLHILAEGGQEIRFLQFLGKDHVIAGYSDGMVRGWSAIKGGKLYEFDSGVTAPVDYAMTYDGKHLAAANATAVTIWTSFTKLKPYRSKSIKGSGGNTLAFSPDAARLALSTGTKSVQLWELDSVKSKTLGKGGNALAFSPNGRILVEGRAKVVEVWEIHDEPKLRIALESQAVGKGAVAALRFSPDGKMLAWRGSRRLIVWNALTYEMVKNLSLPSNSTALAFSPDNHHIVCAGDKGRLYIVRLTAQGK